jgi:hypothetical protein
MPSLASNDSSFSTAIPKQTDKSPQQNCRPVATERKVGLKEAFRAIERQQCWRLELTLPVDYQECQLTAFVRSKPNRSGPASLYVSASFIAIDRYV